MKLGVAISVEPTSFGPLLFPGRMEQALSAVQRTSLDGVELSVRDSEILDQDRVLTSIRAKGLEVLALATGQGFVTDGVSLFGETPDQRARAIARLRGHIDFAVRAECPVIIGGIRGRLGGTDGDRYSAGMDALKNTCDYAAQQDVELLLEMINRYETDLFNRAEEGVNVLEEVACPNLKLLLDTFHMNIEESASIERCFATHLNAVGYVHFADNNRRAPGQGHLDFHSIVQALRSGYYTGPVTCEVLPLPDSSTALEHAAAYCERLLGAERP